MHRQYRRPAQRLHQRQRNARSDITTNAMATATFPDDCLPPEAVYESREALFKAINSWAKTRGYAFSTQRSTKEKNGKLTVIYACDRSQKSPTTPISFQRRTTTRKTNCPFSVLAKESSNTWVLKHRPDQRFSQHNHEPSQYPSAHPVHRQLSGGMEQLATLSNAGLAPKEIQTLVRESGSLATRQDIYTRIADVRRDACGGQSPIHALANQLDKEGFWSQIQFTPDG